MGPAGLGAVIGILFLNAYGKGIPRRLVIDIGLVAMGITLIGLALVKPVTSAVAPALGTIESNLPEALAPLISLIAVVVVIAVSAGIEYAFVAIPSQTALQEELPVGVRGRIFGILNTLLSVASFLPVLIAPVAADLLNLVFKGRGYPGRDGGAGRPHPVDRHRLVAAQRRRRTARRRHASRTRPWRARMRSRLLAGAILIASGLIAWLAISAWPAARLLQGAIGLSLLYVAYLAWRGWRVMRDRPRSPTAVPGNRPWITVLVPAADEAAVIAAVVGRPRWRRTTPMAAGGGLTCWSWMMGRRTARASWRDVAAEPRRRTRSSVCRREAGTGPRTKGAVLAWAQPQVRGDVVAVVDADARVASDFLAGAMRRLVA